MKKLQYINNIKLVLANFHTKFLFRKSSGQVKGMGWHQKGKFGIHSGRTLRRYPFSSFYFSPGSGRARKYRHEYAVVKELKLNDPIRWQSFDKNSIKLGIGDGEIPLDDGSVVYSLNKHKRWLLPDLVKENVEERYWDEIWKSERYSQCTKPEKARKENTDELLVTVVERHAANNMSMSQPDCISVTSGRPSHNTSKPQRKPRKRFAHVADLKSNFGADVEVCYEFLSPFPKKSWPSNKQMSELSKKPCYHYGEKGTKSSKKCKGRNKRYQHPDTERDDGNSADTFGHEEEVTEKECDFSDNRYHFPVGSYIDAMLRLGKKNGKKGYSPATTNQTLPSNPVYYGKGEAIYVEKEAQAFFSSETNKNLNHTMAVTEIGALIVDEKVKVNLLSNDIVPDSLLQEFGNSYLEDDVLPRKFIIKAQLSKTLPNVFTEMEECCILFEVGDTFSSAVEADVTVLLPNEDVMPRNLVQILQDIKSLSKVGPLTVMAIVKHATEKIISKIKTGISRNHCSRKSVPSIAKAPIEFIQNVCQKKPEICGIRDATRYSMESRGEKEGHLLFTYLSKDECDSDGQFCEICYGDARVATGFVSLIRCSHRFCNDCWTSYITSSVDFGQSSITCPHFKCNTIVGEPIVWSRTNSRVYQQYTKLKRQAAINTNHQLRHCPTAECTQIAFINSLPKKESSITLPILCRCGQTWCFGCQKDAHWPASCKEAESFRKKCEDYEDLKRAYHRPGHITSVQVKRCPFCSHPIEKIEGCQHMVCRCENEFCWECLSPWRSHEWDKCDESRKALEDIELAVEFGNARFNKYSKIFLENFFERSGKRLAFFRRLMKRAKQVNGTTKLLSFNLETSASRRQETYADKSLGTFLEQIFHFKYLAHLVLENTAAALAVSKTRYLLKSLDKLMRKLHFIVQRLNEIFPKPEVLADDMIFENAKYLLFEGEKLIKNIYVYTRARN